MNNERMRRYTIYSTQPSVDISCFQTCKFGLNIEIMAQTKSYFEDLDKYDHFRKEDKTKLFSLVSRHLK